MDPTVSPQTLAALTPRGVKADRLDNQKAVAELHDALLEVEPGELPRWLSPDEVYWEAFQESLHNHDLSHLSLSSTEASSPEPQTPVDTQAYSFGGATQHERYLGADAKGGVDTGRIVWSPCMPPQDEVSSQASSALRPNTSVCTTSCTKAASSDKMVSNRFPRNRPRESPKPSAINQSRRSSRIFKKKFAACPYDLHAICSQTMKRRSARSKDFWEIGDQGHVIRATCRGKSLCVHLQS